MTDLCSVRPEDLLAELGWVRTLARSLVRDADQADELTQETCVAALQNAPRETARLRPWLGRIVRNLARQQARAARARHRREAASSRADRTDSVVDTLERASIQHRLVAAVFRLSTTHRDTVLLRFFDGLPQREIARRMATTPATVNSRLTRALAQLRVELDREHGGDRREWLAALAPILIESGGVAAPLGVLLMQMKAKLVIGGLGVAAIAVFWSAYSGGEGREDAEPVAAQPPASPLHDGGGGGGAGAPGGVLAERRAIAPGVQVKRPAAEVRTVEGRVLGASGQPAAGVEVQCAGGKATATSDALGRFALRAPAGGGQIVAADDSDWVTVFAGTYAYDSSIEPTVVVAPALRLGGRIVDEDGRGIDEAHVRLHLPDDFAARFADALDRTKRIRWETRSAREGAFALGPVPMVAGSYLRVLREPYAPAVVGAPSFSDAEMYVVLRRAVPDGFVLRGRVVDDRRAAVEGARVGLGRTSFLTGEDGAFEIPMAKAGRPKELVAVVPGHLPGWFHPPTDASGAPVWPPYVEIQLGGEALAISGRVLDLDDEPVAGALVWALDTTGFGQLPVQIEYMAAGGILPPGQPLELPPIEDPSAPVKASTRMNHAKQPTLFWYYETADEEGRFTLPGLMGHEYRLRAMHPESVLTATTEPIAAGASGVEIRMPAEATHPVVAGRIVSDRGEPLEGIRVLIVCQVYSAGYRTPEFEVNQQLIRHGAMTSTDADGRFSFEDVPRERILLSIYGDSILPRICHLEELGDPEGLEIEVRGRYHLQVILSDPTMADAIGATNDLGERTTLAVIRSGSHNEESEMPLRDGRSAVVAVGGATRTVLLLKQGAVVAEVPVTLVLGETTVVRR